MDVVYLKPNQIAAAGKMASAMIRASHFAAPANLSKEEFAQIVVCAIVSMVRAIDDNGAGVVAAVIATLADPPEDGAKLH